MTWPLPTDVGPAVAVAVDADVAAATEGTLVGIVATGVEGWLALPAHPVRRRMTLRPTRSRPPWDVSVHPASSWDADAGRSRQWLGAVPAAGCGPRVRASRQPVTIRA